MRLKRKARNILSIILVTLLTFGLGFGIYAIASTKTKTISPTVFSVGGIGNDGNYMANKRMLYTKDMFECQGLKIERDFESTVEYDIHYYDVVEGYLGYVECKDDSYVISGDYTNARYCRVVIRPSNRVDDISIFEKYSIANELEITVDKNQNYLVNNNMLDFYTKNSYFQYKSDGTATFNANNIEKSSYYVSVAEASESFYNRVVILSTYDLVENGISAFYSTGSNKPENDTKLESATIAVLHLSDGEKYQSVVDSFVTKEGYYAYVITFQNKDSNSPCYVAPKKDCYLVFNCLKTLAIPQVYLYTNAK